jgi:hypothetical protein
MTTLNNDIRDRLVAKVMADLPPVADPRAGLRDEALTAAISRLPEAIQKLYKDAALNGYLNSRNYSVGSITVPNIPYHGDHGWYAKGEAVFGDEMAAKMEEASTAYRQANLQRDALRDSLTQDFKVIKTFKVFREAYPEFAKYLPEEASSKGGAMVRSDAVDRAKALGWKEEA